MSYPIASSHYCDNRLLARLTADQYECISGTLEPINILPTQVLIECGKPIDYVYFPCTTIVSVLTTMQDGVMVEFTTIGNEGLLGVDLLAGATASLGTVICNVPGKALRMPVAAFKQAIQSKTPLRHVAQGYLLAYLSLLTQSVACDRMHSVEARFARWMLMAHDRAKGNEFLMTHGFLSQMLGAHCSSVSFVTSQFQQAGIIKYNRGRMSILKRDAMEGIACECYALAEAQFERSIGPFPK